LLSNGADSEASDPAMPPISPAPPTITMQLASDSDRRLIGGFTVKAAGTPPLSCQWRKDDIAIANATGATYAIAGAVEAEAGS